MSLCFSIDKVSKVASPVLVIHGTEDEVIDFSHGLAIYERCPRAVEPLWVEGAGHNDIELYAQYLERLKQFITFELATSWSCGAAWQAEAHTHSCVSCRVPLYPGLRTPSVLALADEKKLKSLSWYLGAGHFHPYGGNAFSWFWTTFYSFILDEETLTFCTAFNTLHLTIWFFLLFFCFFFFFFMLLKG